MCCWSRLPVVLCGLVSMVSPIAAFAADLPSDQQVQAVKLFEVHAYCEGVVFDHAGRGYVSHGDRITQFTVDGKNHVWATTGAPNGHKILADGTHLVCDASRHAVLTLNAEGELLANASEVCDGKPLRGPNDLTLDVANGGFYFTDPGDSSAENPIGTLHYVDREKKTHLCAGGFAYPNGVALTTDGKRLLMGESQKNRILEFQVTAPGKLTGMRVFADLPTKAGEQVDNQPDGICFDEAGNLYVAHYGMKQVQVLDPHGKLIRRYAGGNITTSNVAFGGPQHNQLFVTGGLGAGSEKGGVFRLDLNVTGLVILPEKKN